MNSRASLLPGSRLRLAPSDFAFLWDECRRCFYLKVKLGITRPHAIMPSIFTAIDGAMKDHFLAQRVEALVPDLAPGHFAYSGKWIESAPLPSGTAHTMTLRGPFDTVVAFDDGTHAVIDFKTSNPKPANLQKYSRQLHAYAYALEHPERGAFALPRVDRLGLLVYEPRSFSSTPHGMGLLVGGLKWVELPKDEPKFRDFLDQVSVTLAADAPPGASDTCAWCKFRATTRAHSY